uniref:F-box domain-containing protein n=1 Tax=Oryza meridionalis TaxID=40149 RepID=A0A0E0CKQ3_9ORYZ
MGVCKVGKALWSSRTRFVQGVSLFAKSLRFPESTAGGWMQHMLFEAAHNGDLDLVRGMAMLLVEGRGRLGEAVQAARLRGTGTLDGMGALHIAASKGRLEVCRYLIEELRLDVDDTDQEGRTPLIIALVFNHVSTVECLLDCGADAYKASHNSLTPIHFATCLGECGMVQLLLAKGACVDPVAYCGTPLHVAATEGRDGAMKILLDHNADFNKMVDGLTPLDTAMDAGELKCINLLIKVGAVVSEDRMLTAENSGSTECFNYLMEETGANCNISDNGEPVNKRKATDLKSLGNKAVEKKDYLSATGFYSKALDLYPDDATLFSNRSLCWHRMGDGSKALLDAHECRKLRSDWPKAYYRLGAALMLLKDYESACEALHNGFKLDPGNSEIEDAFREALESLKTSASTEASQRPPPAAPVPLSPRQEMLLEEASDGDLGFLKRVVRSLDGGRGRQAEAVEAVRECGAGALHLAAGAGKLAVCRYLVEELRVDANAFYDQGPHPLTRSHTRERHCETPLAYAVNGANIATVRYLLDHGAHPDKVDNKGFTPLHFAAEEGYCNIVELLLAKGAQVDSMSVRGTPLHLAATNGQHRVVEILLDHNADCNKIVSAVYTPLLVAIYGSSLKCVKLLIKAGADVNGVGNITPLIASVGSTEIMKCLLEAGADPNVPDEFGRMPIEFAVRCGTLKDVNILFPLTSPMPTVPDWSVRGIIRHVNTLPGQKDYESGLEKEVAGLKLQGVEALKRQDYLAASDLYTKDPSVPPPAGLLGSFGRKENPGLDGIALAAWASPADELPPQSNPETPHREGEESLCFLHMGDGDKAYGDAYTCRMMRPDWPKACCRQGAALMLLKEYQKACDALLDGFKLDPGNSEIENALSMDHMRSSMQRGGLPPEMLEVGMELMRILVGDSIPDPPVSTLPRLAPTAAARAPADGVDRISRLPDELLRDVVSRLPARDGARTAALSTRWRGVWRSVPLALVDAHLAPEGRGGGGVVAAVSSVLAAHPGPFRCAHLTTTSMEAHRGEVARWLEALAAKGVQELVFVNRPWPLDLRLPAALFGCSSLTRLHVGVWRLPDTRAVPRGAAFPHLREMVLSCVVMEDRDLAFLLDRSPALEKLAIITCQDGARVRLASRSLRILQVCLTVVNYVDVVDAPRLERLMLWMTSKHRSCLSSMVKIRNAPKLRSLGFMEPGMHELEIGNTIIQAGMKLSPSTVVRSVKILALEVKFAVRDEARMLPSFLKCFPNVETLHIHSAVEDEPTGKSKLNLKFWQDAGPIECVQHHIKKVIMREFRGTKSELTFLKFVAERARKLERMVVVVTNGCFCSSGCQGDTQAQMETLMASAKWASEGSKLVAFENPHSQVGTPAWSFRFAFNFDWSDPFDYGYDQASLGEPVSKRKATELKSLGNKAVEKKDYLSATGFYRYCNIVELLLAKGAQVDSMSVRGTPLHLAATNGQHRVVEILLDHNADCNKIVSAVYTPLLVAIYGSSLKCVKLLIKAGADVNGVGNITPLIASVGSTEIMKCLLEAGADPNVPDEFGRMPIEFAVRCGTLKDVNILFPLTSPMPTVPDWSVRGIIRHVNTLPGQKDYESGLEKEVAGLKLQGVEALKRQDYLAASDLYTKDPSVPPPAGLLGSFGRKENPGLDGIALAAWASPADELPPQSNPETPHREGEESLCFLHMGDGDKAYGDAYTCRMMRPDWPKACCRQGAALMLLKEYQKACDALLDGFKLDPGNSEIENALSMDHMRSSMQRGGLPPEMLEVGMELMRILVGDSIPDPPVSTLPRLAPTAAARAPADGVDRISRLPDELLRDVVSRLPARDGARTAALSTRWRGVWRSVPLALVDAHLAPEGRGGGGVVAAVSSVLAAHPGPFRCAHLTTTSMEAHRGEVARWLEALAAKGVQELVFVNRPWPLDLRLPAALFGCSSLTRLHVGVWRLPDTRAVPRGAAFPHLREMVLSCVVMEDRDLAFLLDRSPALEKLAIITCQDGARVRLASRSLRILQVCLTVVNYVDVVDAPRLERLMLWMTSKHRSCLSSMVKIRNAPKLRSLGFMEPGMHELEIGNTIIQAGMKLSPSTVVRSVKILALEVKFAVRDEARMLPSFLKCFPNVETLHIHSAVEDEPTGKSKLNLKFWQDAGPIECVQHHIKKVIMREFRGTKSELTFLKFVAERARKLERMVVVVTNGCFCSSGCQGDTQAQMETLMASAKWASEGSKLVAFENPHSQVGTPAWSFRFAFNFDWSDPFDYGYDQASLGEPVSKRKATELKSLGNKAVEKKDYLSATGFYSQAVDLYPDDATLFSNRSLCWHHMGDGHKALLDAYECRKLRPDWLKAYYRQGAALMLLKDYESACETLYDGFKLDPGNSEMEDPRAPTRRLLQAAADGDLAAFKSKPSYSLPVFSCCLSVLRLVELPGAGADRSLRLIDAVVVVVARAGIAGKLDCGGKGRLRETVEGVRDRGAGALHVASGRGMLAVCSYLVEELQVDVDAADDSGDTPLAYAVRGRSIDGVKYLLDHGANPDKPDNKGYTPLHVAAIKGECEIAKILLSRGAHVDSFSSHGTPLHLSAFCQQDGVMKILLDHHADFNKLLKPVFTPLIMALNASSLKCVELLLKAGADVKGVGTVTPLITAANNGQTDFYKCLLEAGADPNVPDEFGHLPIELAAYNNRRKDVEILLPATSRIPSVCDWSVDGDDPMYKMSPADMKLAASEAYRRQDYITAMKLYTRMGAGVNALQDAQICRLMHSDWSKACYLEGAAQMLLKDFEKACDAFFDGLKLDPASDEIAEALRKSFESLKISHAAKVGPGVPQQLLIQSAAAGDLPAFKKFARMLDGGKGRLKEAVEAVKNRSAGALHQAARYGRTAMCAYMVEELQVDIDAADELGATPLGYAIYGGIVDTVSYLPDHGANPDKPNEKGCTPLHLAVEQGHCEIVKVLLVKGANVDSSSDHGTPLHVAASKSQDGCMKILLDHHADCNKTFSTVCTPLIAAMMGRSLKCCKLLIEAGADVKGVGTFTPLIVAATEGLTDFYKCLLEGGADPDVPDKFGFLPIEIAARQNRWKDVEILLPVTSRIPSVHDWSVDGMITYVNKQVEVDPFFKIRPADLRLEGNRAYMRKDYLTAAKLYNMAIEHDPEDMTVYSNTSVCWLKMGKGMNALETAQVCRILRPDWPKGCYREGTAHMFLKDYEKACNAFLDGFKLDPANIEIENALREALKSLKASRAA